MFWPRLLLLLGCLAPLGAQAHEFWIEPTQYEVAPGSPVQAYFKNGEEFKGATLAYFDRSSARFEMVTNGTSAPLTPRSGDSPALDVTPPPGLNVVIHETTASRITYKDWAKFAKFAAHKDFAQAEAIHDASGWPRENFRESYTRHAKSLIAVGDSSGSGQDAETGMLTEFVAITNPYAPNFAGEMKVRVLFQGQPRRGAQVEVFAKGPDDAVQIDLYRTDDQGIASVPVEAGHSYLFDAVVLRPSDDRGDRPEQPILWQTHWAALTFAVPD